MNRLSPLLRRLALVSAMCLAIAAAPKAAQAAEGTSTHAAILIVTDGISSEDTSLTVSETSVERLSADDAGDDYADNKASRFSEITLSQQPDEGFAPSRAPIASYGPFHLVSADTVEMIGTVDSATPRAFAALLAAHPGVRHLVMVECPGSVDESANHILARAVRRAGLSTRVPDGGSVRSGAVDLFLAGTERSAAPSAEFGVHSWRDEDGYEARDFAATDPVHAEYISYYREMGLSDAAARAFYALTNSVGFDDVRTLHAHDMASLGLARVAG
ncbi:MAG: alpha/beta hydrolase [Sphingopyxis sp.]